MNLSFYHLQQEPVWTKDTQNLNNSEDTVFHTHRVEQTLITG